jgi:hypothetical protein
MDLNGRPVWLNFAVAVVLCSLLVSCSTFNAGERGGFEIQLGSKSCEGCSIAAPTLRDAVKFCAQRHAKETRPLDYVFEEFGIAEFFDCVSWPNRKPVTGCYEAASAIARFDRSVVGEPLGEHELFPPLGKRASINTLDHGDPTEEFKAAVKRTEILFQDCISRDEDGSLTTGDRFIRDHVSARTELLSSMSKGDLTFGAYYRKLFMLDSQLEAGVFIR